MVDDNATQPTRAGTSKRRTIGLISDTHSWFHPGLRTWFAGVELIVHAGDIGHPDVLDALAEIAPVAAVRGNIDGGDLLHLVKTRVVSFAGKRIGVLHIAGSPRSPNPAAHTMLATGALDALVVGHSHITVVSRVREALWLNPGAAGNHGIHVERTAMLLHVEPTGEISLDRVMMGRRGGPVDQGG